MAAGYNHYFNSFDLFGLLGLDPNALSQVNKIGPLNISFTQWTYISQFDQGLNTTNDVIFNTVTGTTEIITNAINELTGGSGVLIDNVLLKDYNIYANNIEHMNMTGFHAWGAGATYYTIAGDQFTLNKDAIGYIRSVPVTCAAGQTVTLIIHDSNIIYFDLTGTLQITDTVNRALYTDNVVLGKVFYDGSSTFFVKENHSYDFQTSVSNFLHDTVGGVIQDGGGNLTYKNATQCKIVGDCTVNDHGLTTAMTAIANDPITFKFMFLDAAGEWEMKSDTSTIPFLYNPAGTPIALTTAAKWGVYRVYCMLDSLNDTTPTFIAIINNASYSNATEISNAVTAGSIVGATKNLDDMECVSLGYILFKNAGVQSVIIQKATINERYTAGSSSSSHLLLSDLDSGSYKMGGHSLMCQKHNAVVDPTNTDDITAYLTGAIWINTALGKQWICIDNTVGAAVWKLLVISAPNQYMDHIDELTAGHGVVIDGVTLKDNNISSLSTTDVGSKLLLNSSTQSDYVSYASTIAKIIGRSTAAADLQRNKHNSILSLYNDNAYSVANSVGSLGLGGRSKDFGGGNAIMTFARLTGSSADDGYNGRFTVELIEGGCGTLLTILNLSRTNFGIGELALYSITSGEHNIGLAMAGGNISSGSFNNCIGYLSGSGLSTASYSVCLGYLANNVNASNCISIGNQAKCGSNEHAIAIGSVATAYSSYGIMIGAYSGKSTAGTSNIGIGAYALSSLNGGTYNCAVGSSSGAGITSAGFCCLFGINAGNAISSGNYNSVFGPESGKIVSTGAANSFFGYDCDGVADKSYQLGVGVSNRCLMDNSVAIGRGNKAGEQSVMLGYYNAPTAHTGLYNVGIGYRTFAALTSGYGNVAIGGYYDGTGYRVLPALTTGAFNLGMMPAAGNSLISGNYNILLGVLAGKSITTSSFNTIIGYESGTNITTLGYHVMIGYDVDTTTSSVNAVSIGNQSASYGDNTVTIGTVNRMGPDSVGIGSYCGNSGVTGSYNYCLGTSAGASLSSGIQNCFYGYYAGQLNSSGSANCAFGGYAGAVNTTGYDNSYLGYAAGNSNSTGYRNTYIGSETDCSGQYYNSTAIGFNAIVSNNNQIRMGNAAITHFYCQVDVTPLSDGRFKENIKPLSYGLDFINQLEPKEFVLKDDETKQRRFGLIAQDVMKIEPDFADTTNPDRYGITYTYFIAPLIKAVQELKLAASTADQRIETMQTEIIYLKKKIKKLKNIYG